MSESYKHRSNGCPFSDRVALVTVTVTEDADGYETRTESERTVWCNLVRGAARADYYEAMKAGVRVDATLELWEDDYQSEQLARFGGHDYKVGRVFTTGRGTLELSLQEVWR